MSWRWSVPKKDNKGITLTELLVALLISSIIAGIATPVYFNARHKGAQEVAISDGNALASQVTSMLLSSTNFGSTNGTISVTNLSRPATVTITLGAGATSPPPSSEAITLTTTANGVTYANSVNWCLDVVNGVRNAIYTETGYQKNMTSCP